MHFVWLFLPLRGQYPYMSFLNSRALFFNIICGMKGLLYSAIIKGPWIHLRIYAIVRSLAGLQITIGSRSTLHGVRSCVCDTLTIRICVRETRSGELQSSTVPEPCKIGSRLDPSDSVAFGFAFGLRSPICVRRTRSAISQMRSRTTMLKARRRV